MARKHREFRSLLDDAEKLRFYAQSAASLYQTLTVSLAKVEASSERWEKEARDGVTNVIRVEKERDEAKQEARAVQMVATAVGEAKVGVEVDLTKALNSLAATEEGGRRSEAEINCLEAELAHVEVSKREVSSFHA